MENKYDQIERIGKWVTYIAEDGEGKHRGYFEHDDEGEGGGLWFIRKSLVDYDGVFVLPKGVKEAIVKLGFSVDEVA